MPATAAQRLLEADLEQADFRLGVAKGQWSLVRPVSEAEWPYVFTWVSAAPRAKSPDQLMVRWDLDGYNAQSPTGAFWDPDRNDFRPINDWPKGKAGSVVATVFKTSAWAAPGRGFYHPYDRQAKAGHDKWPTQNPASIWTSANTLTDFLTLVHRWLNCEDYLGCQPAA